MRRATWVVLEQPAVGGCWITALALCLPLAHLGRVFNSSVPAPNPTLRREQRGEKTGGKRRLARQRSCQRRGCVRFGGWGGVGLFGFGVGG